MAKKTDTTELNRIILKTVQERKSLGQLVYENLKLAIVNGDISGGTRLVESQIAEVQGISRTPVREAIHKLEREGFVVRHPKGGFTVLGFNREDIEETFGIRSVLEGYAAKLAAIRHRPEELKSLEKKINEFQYQLNKNQLKILPRINTEFHDLLYSLSKSNRLIHMINGLRDQIYRFRQMILKEQALAKISNEDHILMLESIRKRDAEGVEKLVREHILRGQEIVLMAFDNQKEA
jgi:DNA-binding GntR family transcriptional regulator